MLKIKVFSYIPELDAFLPTKEFQAISEQLGIIEWNPVVWIGRLFLLDNDFGEHWFDNWELREAIEVKAQQLGYESDELLILDPKCLTDDKDGPCHTAEFRKKFWTDVLSSLELSLELLFEKAREVNQKNKEGLYTEFFIENLEERIRLISAEKEKLSS